MSTAKLSLNGKDYELPVIVGTENEVAIDIRKLRSMTGAITLDSGYGNTGSCESSITYINGEEGILRYRGYDIDDLARNASFIEVAYLLIYGELPDERTLLKFRSELSRNSMIHEDMKKFFDGFHPDAHPMAILSSMVTSLSAYFEDSLEPEVVDRNIIRLLAQVKTLAAYSYRKSEGQPYVYPHNTLGYAADFLWMMFKRPNEDYDPPKVLRNAVRMLLILHADHEQNCSTSTVRMVGSSHVSLFAAISAGISALWGDLHGGANQAVIDMLQHIQDDGGDYQKYMNMAKDKSSGFRLMGFGHRVYKNYDPRARILKETADEVLEDLGIDDPLLDIAKNLEKIALEDSFFVDRKLYPNVDFYSGIIYRAMGIPTNMFTVMFALGRLPGWIAHWREMHMDPTSRINRPRQVYQGATRREYQPMDKR